MELGGIGMIALACDHTALEMKREIIGLLDEMKPAANAVADGECDRGLVICGTGVGISLAANKVKGIRCVVCSEPYSAQMSRLHNNANMLAFGARVIGPELAKMIARVWLETPFEGGRHQRRVDLITRIEKGDRLA